MGWLINIEKDRAGPIFRQIMDRIVEMVDAGTLAPGARLPATRSLAEQLGVNRSTVYRAYQELWSMGYLESRPGSYSRIRKRIRLAPVPPKTPPSLIDWASRCTGPTRTLCEAFSRETDLIGPVPDGATIDFVPLAPDSRLFPLDDFRKCMNRTLVREGHRLLQYGSPQGYEPLRKIIAERMRRHSMKVSADEILITTGAQNAIQILVQALTEPGDKVVIEMPTYSRAMGIFRLGGVTMSGVSMNDDGMDLTALERLLGRITPAMVYTIPNFHNPTGITTDQAHRERLLRICERRAIPLVEDGFEEEMKYFGKPVLPIKSMDHQGVVIYLGTFSKVLFPGLRIGWVAAEKALIDRLTRVQQASILSGNLLGQAALARFCRQGYYDRHVRRFHRAYRRRMKTALSALERHFPAHQVTWTRPAGGYTIWVGLTRLALGEAELLGCFTKNKVRVMPGSVHYHGDQRGLSFRLSIAHLDEGGIETGIRRLGRAIRRLYERGT
jgi:DNA-binding transcriptional MocR family regulator